ncbi:hypothetical protein OPS25_13500 [Alteromonas ponticola]|uniref:Uncharacterized protein n=1 Tax=Alteromonas aquimaris TaxID=2998417 RepID=A0ABT3P9Z3_9ALTE|nr:hypothetical protein [Alteromonas aquimaris]MCW8109520.1 hypothetical protein [Alteromonas aquimaris]
MKKVTPPDTEDRVYFFDKPENVRLILRVFYFLCVVLFILDFFVHRHIYVYFESVPTFYALYGFVACVVLVLIAKLMRKVLMRNEDYFAETSHSPSPNPDNKESEH